jgi:hypothetical protein
MNRSCGDCTACCRILPVPEIDKPALTRCAHQRHGKGCSIYDKRPMSCRLWSCLWLTDEATSDLSRPDRSHYVLDPVPDYVTATYDDQPSQDWPVMQIWVDERHPDAHRDPALRAMLDKFMVMSIVRTGSDAAFLLCPPSRHPEGIWEERRSNVNMDRVRDPERTAAAWKALSSEE